MSGLSTGGSSNDGDANASNNNSDGVETDVAAIIFEGVPNFEFISESSVNNGASEPETLSVRCTSMGGEMLINTIEVTTDELMRIGQTNSEEVFQQEDVNDNHGNEIEMHEVVETGTYSGIPGEYNSVTTFRLDGQEPRLLVQRQVIHSEENVPATVFQAEDVILYDSEGTQDRNATPPPTHIIKNDVTFTTIEGKRMSFHSSGIDSNKIAQIQGSSNEIPENDDDHAKVILTSNIEGLEQQQIPVIIKTATLAQQTVTAALTAQHSENRLKKASSRSRVKSCKANVTTFPEKSTTVQLEMSEGNVIELQKFYCQPGLCRVCLLPKDNLTSIFEDVSIDACGMIENSRGPNATKFHLYRALKTLLNIEVEYNDGLPDGICLDCYDNLMSFSVYRKKIAIGQAKLNQILDQVKHSNTPTFIPSLGELDGQNVDIYKNSSAIQTASNLLKKSQYSHLVVRNLSDRMLDKIFSSMSHILGCRSGKLKILEQFSCEVPYVSGFFCYTCNSTIHGTKEDFAQHHYDFHGVTSREDVLYPCDVCGNKYPLKPRSTEDSQSYSQHWLQHFFMHECNFCNKKLPSSKGLWVHKKSIHARKEKTFVCAQEGCEKAFLKKSHLDSHKESHNTPSFAKGENIRVKLQTERNCFSSPSPGSSDMLISIERPWQCDVVDCQKRFKRKEVLVVHKETVHLNMRKYECEICGETYKSQSSKTVHMLKHKGEKRHACDICSKEFYTTNCLKSHMVKHQESGEFQCDECPKVFKRAAYLEEHKRTHTGETPFTCPVCTRAFRMKSNYFKHMRIHKRKNEIS